MFDFSSHTCPAHSETSPQRSPPRLLTEAACSGLDFPPDRQTRRTYLHHRYSKRHDLHDYVTNLTPFQDTPTSTTTTPTAPTARSTNSHRSPPRRRRQWRDITFGRSVLKSTRCHGLINEYQNAA
jgi:hypothetical protein